MPSPSQHIPAGPFGVHDYRIELAPNEVNIHAHAALPLCVGDHYTVGLSDGIRDLIAENIRHLSNGRWHARCRIAPFGWRAS